MSHMGKKVYTLKYYKTNPPSTHTVKVVRDVSIADTTELLLERAMEGLTAPVKEYNSGDTDSENDVPVDDEEQLLHFVMMMTVVR
jgi:hypothetical protein